MSAMKALSAYDNALNLIKDGCDDALIIPNSNYTKAQLIDGVENALAFHREFTATVKASPERGLYAAPVPDWAQRLLRKKDVPEAVIEKIGSVSLSKRRPDDTAPFLQYVRATYTAQSPLEFRIAFGPLKNVNCCDHHQSPDLAEYLTFIQLARVAVALVPLYPYGIKIQVVPDDLRARKANLCPVDYTQTYITGLKSLVKSLGFEDWLSVEDGESRLYALHGVETFQAAAETRLQEWKAAEPEQFEARWQAALENAEKNVAVTLVHRKVTDISSAAWRYLVAHQAEILSGMWSPQSIFPLVYANHPNAYQIFPLGVKKTKLPWQICMPLDLLDGTDLKENVSAYF